MTAFEYRSRLIRLAQEEARRKQEEKEGPRRRRTDKKVAGKTVSRF